MACVSCALSWFTMGEECAEWSAWEEALRRDLAIPGVSPNTSDPCDGNVCDAKDAVLEAVQNLQTFPDGPTRSQTEPSPTPSETKANPSQSKPQAIFVECSLLPSENQSSRSNLDTIYSHPSHVYENSVAFQLSPHECVCFAASSP